MDPVAFINSLSVESLIVFMVAKLVILVFPILTLRDCWHREGFTQEQKRIWTAVIVVTWPLFAIGAFIYAITYFQNELKVGSIVLLALVSAEPLAREKAAPPEETATPVIASANPSGIKTYAEVMASRPRFPQQRYDYAVQRVQNSSASATTKQSMLHQLQVMRYEMTQTNLTPMQHKMYNRAFSVITDTIPDGKFDEAYDSWSDLFEDRKNLADNDDLPMDHF